MSYNWKITEHQRTDTLMELQVCSLAKELTETWCYNAESWCEFFNNRLNEIKPRNASATLFYKATPRNQKSLEVWKLRLSGDYNYKLYTINLID